MDRYQNRPPVVISPDLTAPWVTQLGGSVQPVVYRQQRRYDGFRASAPPENSICSSAGPIAPARRCAAGRHDAGPQKPAQRRSIRNSCRRTVAYETQERPGTIVIDTNSRFLYLVTGKGQARRYGVGVGKPGFEWAGVHKVTRKSEWPVWTPPSEMIAREAAKGRICPSSMEGGPANPLGARAMYLGSTLYRIHGTNAPWTIGFAVSSGCIRMRNEDVVDLYERVKIGTKVVVI